MAYIPRTVRFRPVSVRKNYQPVSRILFPRQYAQSINSRAAIIYLAPVLLQGSSCLPSGIGRAALSRRYTWHFSMQGLPAPAVTCRRRGLLPHVFSLTAPLTPGGSYFLWHSLWTGSVFVNAPPVPRRLTGTLPCAVRTFLPLRSRER